MNINRKSIIINRVENGWIISKGMPCEPDLLKIAATEDELLHIVREWATPPAADGDTQGRITLEGVQDAWAKRSSMNPNFLNTGALVSSWTNTK